MIAEHDDGRREFLRSAGVATGGAWLALQWPAALAAAAEADKARRERAAFVSLGDDEADDIEAIAACIIPSDDSPGAREAGVVYFVDRALESFMAGQLAWVRSELGELNAALAASYPGSSAFASLDAKQQIEFLTTRDDTPFFGFLHFITLVGMFAMPSYGGNRDGVGWELLGFDHRHAWQPPFGYYDALAAKRSGEQADG